MADEIDTLLLTADRAVIDAEREFEAAKDRLETARADRGSLRRVIARHRGSVPAANATVEELPAVRVEWARMTRPVAIVRLLQERGKPMGPTEITQALKDLGRSQETPNLISNTLVTLSKRKLIESPERGKWMLTPLAQRT